MLERDIQKSILQYLTYAPQVAWAARINSGATLAEYKGKKRFIRYNSLRGCPDIMGQLKDGRHLAIEVKKPDWKGVSQAQDATGRRERTQEAHIKLVNDNGGVAMFASSIDGVKERLDEK